MNIDDLLADTAAADATTSWLDTATETPFDAVRATKRGYLGDVKQTRERHQQQLADIKQKAEGSKC